MNWQPNLRNRLVNSSQIPVIVLAGPTATGKSSQAVDLALAWRLDGITAEVVSADSMAVYRGMDIGTAKPAMEQRSGVPHHLIDIMDIAEPASVAGFQQLARCAIADCQQRGVVPIVVGGSALYLHAIIDEFDFPPTDPNLRTRLLVELEANGVQVMYQRLCDLSPTAAAGIEPSNSRRIVRALEAIELTGQFNSTLPPPQYALDGVIQIGLEINRVQMDARIAARVNRMWESGFVDEVRRLLDQGLRQAPTAARAIGYRQIIEYLDDQISAEEALETTIVRTRQFSRKQLGWWTRDRRINWLPASTNSAEIIQLIRSVAK